MRSLLFATILLGACASGGGEELSSTRRAITNGAVDAGDGAVVALVDDSGAVVCTAVMLSAHVAITAAHCGIGANDFRAFRAVAGPNVSGERLEISDAKLHPGFDPASFRDDLALLTIRPVFSGKPVTSFGAPMLDAELRVVGYGQTEGGKLDAGTKRSGTSKIASVTAEALTLTANPSQPCEGDSGGPAFSGEALVGLTSHGDAACTTPTTDTRIDAYLDAFVTPYLAARPAPGERCFYDGHCLSGTCTAAEDEPSNTFCAVPCDAGCPTGTTCRNGLCRWPLPSAGAPSSTCSRDADCIEGECISSVCVRRCNPASPSCPSSFHCENTGGIQYRCVADPAPPESSSGCSNARASDSGWLSLLLLGLLRRRARS